MHDDVQRYVSICKHDDKEMNMHRLIAFGYQINYNTVTNAYGRSCCVFLPDMWKANHTQANCLKRKRDQQKA